MTHNNTETEASADNFGVPTHIYGQPSQTLRVGGFELSEQVGVSQRWPITYHELPVDAQLEDGLDPLATYHEIVQKRACA